MTTKYKPILWWPQKNIDKIFIPQIFFLKTPKNIEIQNFDPPPKKKKMTRAYVCMKISEYPPGILPSYLKISWPDYLVFFIL